MLQPFGGSLQMWEGRISSWLAGSLDLLMDRSGQATYYWIQFDQWKHSHLAFSYIETPFLSATWLYLYIIQGTQIYLFLSNNFISGAEPLVLTRARNFYIILLGLLKLLYTPYLVETFDLTTFSLHVGFFIWFWEDPSPSSLSRAPSGSSPLWSSGSAPYQRFESLDTFNRKDKNKDRLLAKKR